MTLSKAPISTEPALFAIALVADKGILSAHKGRSKAHMSPSAHSPTPGPDTGILTLGDPPSKRLGFASHK